MTVHSQPESKSASAPTEACASCPTYKAAKLKKLGLNMDSCDYVIALAGNPNTGKSTVFNALTGLRQHTGNWPGKTVARAEGAFEYQSKRFKMVDLPGTYSLLSTSVDEEIARDFILFGQPDVTIVVADATRLERNLNLVLQVLEITDRVVLCLNLADEAKRHGIVVDARQLSRDLGIPVITASARFGHGLPELLNAVQEIASHQYVCDPFRIKNIPLPLKAPLDDLIARLQAAFPDLPNARWVALRLLGGDARIMEALRKGDLKKIGQSINSQERDRITTALMQERAGISPSGSASEKDAQIILDWAHMYRSQLRGDPHEFIVEAVYAEAARIASRCISHPGGRKTPTFDQIIDRMVTSRIWGFPVMLLLFAFMLWITIVGANYPSGWLSSILLDKFHPILGAAAQSAGFPWWLRGLLVDGMYLATAWVVSVMLPPMAIFFPLFTMLEDFGYLPRVAFNLDRLFKRTGAHGKQAMSIMMGFGCNAAGVVSARIIDSPRERLIAVITNNFALCNGRWPTQFLIASLFIGSLVPAHLAGLVSALAVSIVALLGIVATFTVSWALSRTILKGEVSTFSLELPPYRPPKLLQTLYTSLVDRTLFVLWRALVFAMPAGAFIWLIANVKIGNASLAEQMIRALDPIGMQIGLNGVILLAYVVAIPANEIVVPTILMLTVLVTGDAALGHGAGVLFELDSMQELKSLLMKAGWTTLTGINLMIFSLLHNPCSTTIYTIYKETGSKRWTALAALLPLCLGIGVTFLIAAAARIILG